MKKRKIIMRKITCTALAVLTVFVYSFFDPIKSEAYADAQGYKWTKVHNETQLEEAISKALDGKSFSSLNRSVDNDSDWVRCMLCWQSGGAWYFTSGTNGNVTWVGQRVLSSYDMEVGAEEFVTRTGLNTPFIKRTTGACEYDGKGEGTNYSFRLSNSNNSLSNRIVAIQMNWYGIKYHAAAYAEFALDATTSNHKAGKGKHDFWVSNVTRECSYNIMFSASWADYFTYGITEKEKNTLMAMYNYRDYYISCSGHGGCYRTYYDPGDEAKYSWALENLTDTNTYDLGIFTRVIKTTQYPNGISGFEAYQKLFKSMCTSYSNANHTTSEGTCWIYNYFSSVTNRYWEHKGDAIDSCQDIDDSDITGFIMYIGIPCETPSHSGMITLEPGITYYYNGEEIKEKCVIIVPTGSTLVIKGHVYNNGYIYVNGGTLLVEGVLDTDSGYTAKAAALNYDMDKFKDTYGDVGAIDVLNGGKVIVDHDGAILSRFYYQRIYMYYNCTLQVDGVVCVPWLCAWGDSTIRGENGSLIVVGCNAADTVDIENYNKEILYTNRTLKFENIVYKATSGAIYLEYGSSFVSNGCFYAPSNMSFTTVGDAYYADFWWETDLRRYVYQGMQYW